VAVEIRILSDDDPDFYRFVGPFLGSRAITKELGGPVWNDPGKLWFVALDRRQPIGICASVREGKRVRLCSDYVIPSRRGEGVYRDLFAARLRALSGEPMIATATDASIGTFLKNGFRAKAKRGRFTVVERDEATE
jgi:hypothetical protein